MNEDITKIAHKNGFIVLDSIDYMKKILIHRFVTIYEGSIIEEFDNVVEKRFVNDETQREIYMRYVSRTIDTTDLEDILRKKGYKEVTQ